MFLTMTDYTLCQNGWTIYWFSLIVDISEAHCLSSNKLSEFNFLAPDKERVSNKETWVEGIEGKITEDNVEIK